MNGLGRSGTMPFTAIVVLAASILIAAAGGCSKGGREGTENLEGFNVLLVTLAAARRAAAREPRTSRASTSCS